MYESHREPTFHSSLWNLRKHFSVLEKLERERRPREGGCSLGSWRSAIKDKPLSFCLLQLSDMWLVCSAYLFMAKLLGKFGINNCFFFFHRSDYWDNPACFMLSSPHPTSPFVYLVISPGGIVYKMCCYYTERIWQLPNSLQHISGQKQVPSCSLLFYRNLHLSITDKG